MPRHVRYRSFFGGSRTLVGTNEEVFPVFHAAKYAAFCQQGFVGRIGVGMLLLPINFGTHGFTWICRRFIALTHTQGVYLQHSC